MKRPATVMGKASEALVTLATTGNPNPLQAELEGTVISSEDLQKQVGNLLNLEKEEHLTPKALVTPTGETYAMVPPRSPRPISFWSITKGRLDEWIWVIRRGIEGRLWSRPSWKTTAPLGTSNSGIGLRGKIPLRRMKINSR
ncbi:hypothetical protein [Nitrospira sp.]